MAKRKSKELTAFNGRFVGATLADKVMDVGLRWWGAMSGIYAILLGAYSKASTLFAGFGWIDAAAFGVVGSIILTSATLLGIAAYRRLRPPILPTRDREEFVDEVVNLADLVGGQEPFITHKKFLRCVIRGPGQIHFNQQVSNVLCSAPKGKLVELPLGANIQGAVIAGWCTFSRCHFDNIAIIGVKTDMDLWRANFDELTLAEWKEKRWAEN